MAERNQMQEKGSQHKVREKASSINIFLFFLLIIVILLAQKWEIKTSKEAFEQQREGTELSAALKQLTACALAVGVIAAGQGKLPLNKWIELTHAESAVYDQALTIGPDSTKLYSTPIDLRYRGDNKNEDQLFRKSLHRVSL